MELPEQGEAGLGRAERQEVDAARGVMVHAPFATSYRYNVNMTLVLMRGEGTDREEMERERDTIFQIKRQQPLSKGVSLFYMSVYVVFPQHRQGFFFGRVTKK